MFIGATLVDESTKIAVLMPLFSETIPLTREVLKLRYLGSIFSLISGF
jgi:hypothetical protein